MPSVHFQRVITMPAQIFFSAWEQAELQRHHPGFCNTKGFSLFFYLCNEGSLKLSLFPFNFVSYFCIMHHACDISSLFVCVINKTSDIRGQRLDYSHATSGGMGAEVQDLIDPSCTLSEMRSTRIEPRMSNSTLMSSSPHD
jgi:hypothetical protein